jgi:hypothetical protein
MGSRFFLEFELGEEQTTSAHGFPAKTSSPPRTANPTPNATNTNQP